LTERHTSPFVLVRMGGIASCREAWVGSLLAARPGWDRFLPRGLGGPPLLLEKHHTPPTGVMLGELCESLCASKPRYSASTNKKN